MNSWHSTLETWVLVLVSDETPDDHRCGLQSPFADDRLQTLVKVTIGFPHLSTFALGETWINSTKNSHPNFHFTTIFCGRPCARVKKVLSTVAQWERHAIRFCAWKLARLVRSSGTAKKIAGDWDGNGIRMRLYKYQYINIINFNLYKMPMAKAIYIYIYLNVDEFS